MLILGKTPDWNTAKKEMSNTDFLSKLKQIKPEDISQKTILKVEKLTKDPKMK